MAQYTAIFTKPYEDGYENLPSQNTPITAETLNDKDDAIVNIETYLSGNDIPSDAEGLSYDNTDSGLTADNVQSAIDEIVTDIPTTAEDIGYDNTDSGLTANNVQGAVDELADEKIDKTGVDVKTNTTGQFNTITGGILQSCVVELEPVQSGSGTPSPDNVRPITGHSSVKVGNVGKNKLPLVLSDIKTLNTAGTWSGNIYTYDTVTFEVKTDNDGNVTEIVINGASTGTRTFYLSKSILLTDNTSYTLTGCPTGGSNSSFRLSFYNGADVVTHKGETNGVTINYTETSGNEVGAYIRVYNQYQLNNLSFKPMIRLATETDATFVPYKGQVVTVALGDTYYGGTLDVVSGVLTIDRLYVVLDGSEDEGWSVEGTGTAQYYFVTGNVLDGLMTATPNPIYNKGAYATIYSSNTTQGIYITGRKVRYRQGAEVSLSDFKASLSNEPLQICYYITTPTTIQLTPQQINTLIGENHLDVPLEGQSLDSLSYREMFAWDDVERAVAVKLDLSSVAPIEYTDKASQSYNQKQLFIKDNKLCQALASISSGASFTENTNFKYTTLAEIIEPLIP